MSDQWILRYTMVYQFFGQNPVEIYVFMAKLVSIMEFLTVKRIYYTYITHIRMQNVEGPIHLWSTRTSHPLWTISATAETHSLLIMHVKEGE